MYSHIVSTLPQHFACIATVTDIGIWLSVYRGTSLFYEDTNLPMFTTYIYRTTVFNRVGQMISPNSTEATTYGGLPRLPANVTAVARDHLSIIVNWTLPSKVTYTVHFLNKRLNLCFIAYKIRLTISFKSFL